LINDYRVSVEDPAAIWTDICSKYGFVSPRSNHIQVSGNPDLGLITYTLKLPTSVLNVRLSPHISRTFKIIEEEDEWNTGEILSPREFDKEQVWNQICAIHQLPHHSQFHISYEHGEVPATSRTLPPGTIKVTRIRFPIKWRLELLSEEVIQDNLHAGMTIQNSWELLHHQIPRLYPHATFNYAGMVQPNLIVTTEVMRELVTLTFCFEVKDNGWITYDGNTDLSNMLTRIEIYNCVKTFDSRIPPLEEYIEEDTRPYQTGVPILFRLKALSPVADLSDEGPGRLGGDNGTGINLPPIIYAAPPINTADPSNPKVAGNMKGTPGATQSAPESDSCPTDSTKDEVGCAHRLYRIAQAIHNQEQVMIVFVGHFEGFQDIRAQCEFRLIYPGPPPPTIKDLFEHSWSRIRDSALRYGSTSVPGSLLWTLNHIGDDSVITSVYRFGKGLKVRFQPKDLLGLPMDKWPAVFTTDLTNGLSVAFPAVPRLPDAVLMQLFVNLTAPWDGKSFGNPWQTYLVQQTWRKSETGETYLQALAEFPADVDPHA
jgi:hypothetical protein